MPFVSLLTIIWDDVLFPKHKALAFENTLVGNFRLWCGKNFSSVVLLLLSVWFCNNWMQDTYNVAVKCCIAFAPCLKHSWYRPSPGPGNIPCQGCTVSHRFTD